MAGETVITVVGNLTDDPELRFTAAGVAVANFRIASTPSVFDKAQNKYVDGDPLFLTCHVWRQPAENTAESLTKGTRVIVTGRLRQRTYETKEGEKRTVLELEVDEIGASLRYATAQLTRTAKGGNSGGRGDDPWAGEEATSTRRPTNADRARTHAASSFDDEPPF